MPEKPHAPALKGVVPGTAPVETLQFALVQRFCDQVLAVAGILVVSGPGGCGKTYAVSCWADRAGVQVVRLHLDASTTRIEMLRAILEGLGLPVDGTGAVLKERLRKALGGRRLVIFVDEGSLLDLQALRTLRYLHDQKDARFALVFTGVDFREAFAGIPEFPSRVKRWVAFEPLSGDVLEAALAATHPVLAATPKPLLRSIDAQYGHGVWRHWANVLEYALLAGATAETGITEPVADGWLGAVRAASGHSGRAEA